MDDDPRISHPDFRTREEDWPDPDVDSDTEEGRESIRVSKAALLATINRSIAQRQRQLEVPGIPDTLYVKAQDHQDQLTNDERRLLLSRSAPRPLDHILSSLELIVTGFRIGSESDQDIIAANWLVLEALQNAIVNGPSPKAALEEMITSMKSLKEQYLLGNMTVKEVMERTWDCLWSCRYNSFMSPPAPAPDPAVESLKNDRYPTSLWPPDSELQTPVRIFALASNLSGNAVMPAWRGLSKDQKEPYRAQYETTRRAAWTARGSPAPDEGHTMQYIRLPHDLDYPISPRDELFRPPMSPRNISGVQVFHDELGGQLELAETLARWQTLPVAQMGLYEARARELDAEQRSAFPATLRHYENYSY